MTPLSLVHHLTGRDPFVVRTRQEYAQRVDPTAPEGPENSESAEATSESRKRSWWRIKLPTAVVVTLAGVALSAWLLPAFTRQWDDRQKANDIKVALVTDIATATASALSDGEQVWVTDDRAQRSKAVRAWSLESLQMEARLRAYFTPGLVAIWDFYSYAIGRFLGSYGVSGDRALLAAQAWLEGGHSFSGSIIFPIVSTMGHLLSLDQSSEQPVLTHYERRLFKTFADGRTVTPQSAHRGLENDLITLGPAIIDDILHSHVSGYSTTKRDLINDLLPF
jgi:hypothetical protein